MLKLTLRPCDFFHWTSSMTAFSGLSDAFDPSLESPSSSGTWEREDEVRLVEQERRRWEKEGGVGSVTRTAGKAKVGVAGSRGVVGGELEEADMTRYISVGPVGGAEERTC